VKIWESLLGIAAVIIGVWLATLTIADYGKKRLEPLLRVYNQEEKH